MLILGHADVADALAGAERQVIDLVRAAYRLHDEGRTVVPFSTFLRFPDNDRDRIIGLPAYVGGAEEVAGMKWIASFPGNLAAGIPRASAAILLNSMRTGRPEALIEGSLISARRTAASAALAAGLLTAGAAPRGITLFGCGVINLEILRFVRAELPGLAEVTLYDTDQHRAKSFADQCATVAPEATVSFAADPDSAMAAQPLISLATTAVKPHLDLSACSPGATVLHVSLRDLRAEAMLDARNVVDDVEHVCRERTSLHLAEQRVGHRDFIEGTIGQLIRAADAGPDGAAGGPDGAAGSAGPDGAADAGAGHRRVTVFSPFGLGALDIALAGYVLGEARRRGVGVRVDDFLSGPAPARTSAAAPAPARTSAPEGQPE